jgi:hypothetical protein
MLTSEPKSGTLMQVSKAGALTMTLVAILWAVTPALACLIPMQQMTPAERECCRKMAQQCGSSVMQSHSCCQGHQRDAAIGPVPTYASTRPFNVAIVPQTSIVQIVSACVSRLSPALEAPPPESSPGCTSVLRI